MRFRVALGASVAVLLVVAAACDLNPQPLPPGEQADGGSTAQVPATGPGGSGGSNGATSGTASDAGVADGGGAFLASDAGSTDGATDGARDGEADAESDAADDAGD
jgi:hypothetical protein